MLRPSTEQELKATVVMIMLIDEVSSMSRSDPPGDD